MGMTWRILVLGVIGAVAWGSFGCGTSHADARMQVAASQAAGEAAASATAPAVSGSQPAGAAQERQLPPITLHLAGDSTVSNYPATTKQEGWGMEIGQFFSDKVKVNNVAIGGASVVTFKNGNWNRLIAAVKPGDYVMIQFGANDSGTVAGRHVSPQDFGAMYGTMADEVKARGGTAIFVTPSAFYQWSGGKQDNARLAPYREAIIKAGKEKGVLVDDLNARGVEWLTEIGEAKAHDIYMPNSAGVPDKAHFMKEGAVKMAGMVAGELKRIGSPLAAYLK
ncbi:MAG TPA: GDSL-type esterase/lipase family protein [Phycisphaerae bacterium]|nr:GDSL-type esterase/lipase family protein [Phycisphaerae bacterium]